MAEEQQKRMSAAELVREQREEHEAALVAQHGHLCVRGTGDVLMLTGAMTAGLALGWAGSRLLAGRWRIAPLAVGGVLLASAYVLSPGKHRFVKKASLTVGGVTLMSSSVFFTFADKIFKEEGIA